MDEPSFYGFQWEDSYQESLGHLNLPDRFKHDVELAFEWRVRREADLLDKPSDGLEVCKFFGDPPLRGFWRLSPGNFISVYWIEEDPNPDGENEADQ